METSSTHGSGGFTVWLLLAFLLMFIGGSLDGPTWVKIALIAAGGILIVFGAMRRAAAARSATPTQSEH